MNLKEWRIHRAMSQRMLAKASGVTYATICRLERGQHKPNFITINKLSDALVLGDPNEIEWDKPSTSSQPVIYIDHTTQSAAQHTRSRNCFPACWSA